MIPLGPLQSQDLSLLRIATTDCVVALIDAVSRNKKYRVVTWRSRPRNNMDGHSRWEFKSSNIQLARRSIRTVPCQLS